MGNAEIVAAGHGRQSLWLWAEPPRFGKGAVSLKRPMAEGRGSPLQGGGDFAPRPPDHHEHCRICAEERRRCEEACSAGLDVIE
jgi:hypothetical protein